MIHFREQEKKKSISAFSIITPISSFHLIIFKINECRYWIAALSQSISSLVVLFTFGIGNQYLSAIWWWTETQKGKKKKIWLKDIARIAISFIFRLNGTTYQEDLQFRMHNNARNAKRWNSTKGNCYIKNSIDFKGSFVSTKDLIYLTSKL